MWPVKCSNPSVLCRSGPRQRSLSHRYRASCSVTRAASHASNLRKVSPRNDRVANISCHPITYLRSSAQAVAKLALARLLHSAEPLITTQAQAASISTMRLQMTKSLTVWPTASTQTTHSTLNVAQITTYP